jgi:hypothetical protein
MPRPRFLSLILAATTGLWLGGLTFYAAVVVPIGSHVVGRMNQGLVTQHVSNWLNVIGIVAIVFLGANAWRERSRLMLITWLVIALLQTFLLVLHPILDRQLASISASAATSGPQFYQWHRAYLIATTIMWLVSLCHLALIVDPQRNKVNDIT